MIELTGLTNALTDVIVSVTEAELALWNIPKGSFCGLNRLPDPENTLHVLSTRRKEYIPAGSPANVIFNAAVLGIKTALFGTVGKDIWGEKYWGYLKSKRINSFLNSISGTSGLCYILVTPDGERSSLMDLGVAGEYGYDLSRLQKTDIFHTSGYELSTHAEKTKETIAYAQKIGAKISFDLASAKIVKNKRKDLEEIIKKAEIVFATEEEITELTNLGPEQALIELARACPLAILKRGSQGSKVKSRKEEYEIPAYPVSVINTNGAGDAYSAGFLFGYLRRFPLQELGHFASYLASRVCGRKESHF